MTYKSFAQLNDAIVHCTKCPRLVAFRTRIAKEKRKQYRDWEYWGRPVTGYGSPDARLLIVGLAPAAHGGNRTGRVFTGDKSAEFLMRCLYAVGLASQPTSTRRDDGLVLNRGYMTPVLRCVPPGDKPTARELANCRPYFQSELQLLSDIKVILALGGIAFKSCLKYFQSIFPITLKDYPFQHNVHYRMPDGKRLVGSYHPSPRNVNTKRLTYEMMVDMLETVKGIL
ncbi:MAG: uracil-DNA glycosylase [FCB group bacterium]|nr:uracil-DNA glycosylase [FCB group bacterium]